MSGTTPPPENEKHSCNCNKEKHCYPTMFPVMGGYGGGCGMGYPRQTF